MSTDGETEVVLEKPKRAPRKRAPKAVSIESDIPTPVKRAPRKRAPKKVAAEVEEAEERVAPSRKAPTPLAADKARTIRSRRHLMVIVALLAIGVASSAAVGFTDKGQINVEAVITQRNEEARAAGNESLVIPVQNTPQTVDGGQIGLGESAATVTPVASSTPPAATSTPATASSTESVPQEGVADAATPSSASDTAQ